MTNNVIYYLNIHFRLMDELAQTRDIDYDEWELHIYSIPQTQEL